MKLFQTIVIELYKQPKETNRNYFSGLLISSIKVSVVDKTNDGVYVSSTFEDVQLLFICFLYCAKQGPVVKNLESDVATLKIITTMKKMIEKNTTNFSVSPYDTLLFSREENIKFSEVVLLALHCNFLISCLMTT